MVKRFRPYSLTHDLKHHAFSAGEETLSVPRTVRLRAQVRAYAIGSQPSGRQSKTDGTNNATNRRGPFKMETFERMRKQVSNVELDFKLRKTAR